MVQTLADPQYVRYFWDAPTHDFLDLAVSPRGCARRVGHGQKPLTTNLQLLKRPSGAVSTRVPLAPHSRRSRAAAAAASSRQQSQPFHFQRRR